MNVCVPGTHVVKNEVNEYSLKQSRVMIAVTWKTDLFSLSPVICSKTAKLIKKKINI